MADGGPAIGFFTRASVAQRTSEPYTDPWPMHSLLMHMEQDVRHTTDHISRERVALEPIWFDFHDSRHLNFKDCIDSG